MLNILYQFNEKYVPYAGTSIVSLLENNKDIDEINIYLLAENVSARNCEMIKQQIEMYQRRAIYMDATDVIERIKETGINAYRNSYATNIKLFVSCFIPNDVERLLYIDSDTLVVGNISELENFDMNGNPIAMVQDSVCARHKKEMGFTSEEPYFNGGVVLYDMDAWREKHCMERICDHAMLERNHYMAPDQDLLNLVLKGHITQLPIAYNLQPLHRVYSYRMYAKYFGVSSYYKEQEIKAASKRPKILHCFRYLGQFPWHKDSLHPDAKQFDFYLEKSLWKDCQKEETEQNDFVFRFERWMYRLFPKRVFILIFKLCYEVFMWKSNRDSMRQKNNARM